MAKITYQTNNWGNSNEAHLEVTLDGGGVVMVTVSEDGIDINNTPVFSIESAYSNAIHLVFDKPKNPIPA